MKDMQAQVLRDERKVWENQGRRYSSSSAAQNYIRKYASGRKLFNTRVVHASGSVACLGREWR